MSKKTRCRRIFDKQHSKRSQTLLKSARKHLYHIYWSLWRKSSWKKSLLMICKILRLFVNTMTADDKYFLLNRDNWTQPIQMRLWKKQKKFGNLFLRSWDGEQIVNILKKKMTLIAYVFLKLRTGKDVVR